MAANLLVANQVVIPIIVLCVLAAIAFVYGFFKRISRMDWGAWQTLIVFAIALLFRFLPEPTGLTYFIFLVCLLCAIAILVLGVSRFIRGPEEGRRIRETGSVSVLDRLLGGITGAVNVLLFAVVVGGIAASAAYFFTDGSVMLLGEKLTKFSTGYALDLLIVTVFVFALKGGYRVGLFRSLWAIAMILLILASIAGSILLAIKVPFLASFAAQLTVNFASLGALLSTILGYAIVSLICFLVFLIVIIVLGVVLNIIVKRGSGRPTMLSGIIVALIFMAVVFCVVCAVNYAAFSLSSMFAENPIGQQIEQFFDSTTLGHLFYHYNPLRLLIDA